MAGREGAQVVLRLDSINKRFGKLVANDAVSLSLHRGEVIALLGENGAGKTTLMNILFGQYTADAGTVEVFGQVLPPGNPRAALDAGVGMVHQHFTLADNMSVLENVILGTRPFWSARLGRAACRGGDEGDHRCAAAQPRPGRKGVGARGVPLAQAKFAARGKTRWAVVLGLTPRHDARERAGEFSPRAVTLGLGLNPLVPSPPSLGGLYNDRCPGVLSLHRWWVV